jgi:putative transcriptional regulator
MYRNLFIAWYCLGVLALSLITFLVLLPYIGLHRASSVGFAWMGLLGLTPLFGFYVFRKEQNDERDWLFLQRSVAIGAIAAASTFPSISAFLFVIFHGYIKTEYIPLGVFMVPSVVGTFTGFLAGSVQLLLFYYKGEHADKEMTKITNTVRRLRFDHGEMTQEELAKKAGVSRQTIIAIESGKYTPSLGLAFKLAEIFGRTIEEIFHVTEEK